MSVFRLMLSHSLPSHTRTDPLLLSQKQKLPAHEWQDIRTTAQIAQVTQNSNHLKKRKRSPRASQKSSSSPVRTSTALDQCCSLSCIHIIRRPRSLKSDYPFLARGLGPKREVERKRILQSSVSRTSKVSDTFVTTQKLGHPPSEISGCHKKDQLVIFKMPRIINACPGKVHTNS